MTPALRKLSFLRRQLGLTRFAIFIGHGAVNAHADGLVTPVPGCERQSTAEGVLTHLTATSITDTNRLPLPSGC